jgi:hypothetical protein
MVTESWNQDIPHPLRVYDSKPTQLCAHQGSVAWNHLLCGPRATAHSVPHDDENYFKNRHRVPHIWPLWPSSAKRIGVKGTIRSGLRVMVRNTAANAGRCRRAWLFVAFLVGW